MTKFGVFKPRIHEIAGAVNLLVVVNKALPVPFPGQGSEPPPVSENTVLITTPTDKIA